MSRDQFQLRSIRLGDEPAGWEALGFQVDPSAAGEGGGAATVRLGNTVVVLSGSGESFEGWDVDGVPGDLDGLARRSRPSGSLESGSLEPVVHRNGIDSIDHVVISSGDVDRSDAVFSAAGLACRGRRSTSSYGAPMRQQFYWLGDVILELVGPQDPEARSDDPATLFGIALVASDLEATAARLGPFCGRPKDAVQPGRHIAGIRGREVGVELPLAVMSPHPGSGAVG